MAMLVTSTVSNATCSLYTISHSLSVHLINIACREDLHEYSTLCFWRKFYSCLQHAHTHTHTHTHMPVLRGGNRPVRRTVRQPTEPSCPSVWYASRDTVSLSPAIQPATTTANPGKFRKDCLLKSWTSGLCVCVCGGGGGGGGLCLG